MTEAQRVTAALQGRWHGRYGVARCPGHADRTPSLTLADGPSGRLLAHCKAGCCFTAVLDALRGLGIVDAGGRVPQTDPLELARYEGDLRRQAETRERQAAKVWAETVELRGSVAEIYLREARGISCILPGALRFHPACWHPTGRRLPAMIALIEGTGRAAIHRTYLRADGSGKAAVEPAKAMLGAAAGGAVRLAQGQGALAVAEGVETALSLLCGPLTGAVAVWATLSTSGVTGLRLPPVPGRLIIATDGDDPGRAAGRALAQRASALGWAVSLLAAPAGRDWNNILLETKGSAA